MSQNNTWLMNDINQMQDILAEDIRNYGENSPRTQQSRQGLLGPSDIGFCRQKASLTMKGVQPTDAVSTAAAQIGTAVHSYLALAFKEAHPSWIIEANKVTATLPSGAKISGTPDIIAPDWNAIIDVKTVDGFEWIKREGTSQNHKFQRHLYALGAIQEGLLDESLPVIVGNLYIDRSGKQSEPMLLMEQFDHTLTSEIDSWVTDVVYSVQHGEDAMRDLPAAVCERICSFFTVCRGSLETNQSDLIVDKDLLSAVNMYVQARDMGSHAEKMKKEAQVRLVGINGSTGEHQVRWVDVAPTTVNSFDKQGYSRMDIRKVRK